MFTDFLLKCIQSLNDWWHVIIWFFLIMINVITDISKIKFKFMILFCKYLIIYFFINLN